MSNLFIGVGMGIFITFGIMLWLRRLHEDSLKIKLPNEEEKGNSTPTIYVSCNYNPDEVKIFYEVPDALAEMIRSVDAELTFVECLSYLVGPYRKEIE